MLANLQKFWQSEKCLSNVDRWALTYSNQTKFLYYHEDTRAKIPVSDRLNTELMCYFHTASVLS